MSIVEVTKPTTDPYLLGSGQVRNVHADGIDAFGVLRD